MNTDHLTDFIDSLSIPNSNGNNLNEIWVDFVEGTTVVENAIRLNPVAIDIDIKPGNKHNIINPHMHGGVWVGLLSGAEMFFDALQVDISSVRFGSGGAKVLHHFVKDINRDGMDDLILRFKVPKTDIECKDSEMTLTGRTFDGQMLIGKDSIRTVCFPVDC